MPPSLAFIWSAACLERMNPVSIYNLNRFIGSLVLDARTRERAAGAQLNEVLRENALDEAEIAEIMNARPQSLPELCALVEQMAAREETWRRHP